MNNIKRPRPAVPVLVHVDNPSGGDSAEVTEEVKSLSNAVGPLSDSAQRRSLVAMTSDMRKALNDSTEAVENIHSNIGTTTDFSTDTTVIGLLKNIKENMTGGGGGGGVDMTTVNTNTTQINDNIGTSSDTTANTTVIGRLANIQQQSILANTALGTASSGQNTNDVIGKLKQIQLNGSNTYTQVTDIKDTTDVLSAKLGATSETGTSGTVIGRLASLQEKTNAINTALGTADSDKNTNNVIGKLKQIQLNVLSSANLTNAIDSAVGAPNNASSSNTVIGLLKAIKENGGSGTGTDMTTVNAKTTAINAAIGATSDESTANTVIGLLKRIIQNN